MIRHLVSSLTHRFAWRIPIFVYGATWTLFLTMTVAIISLAPEFAFVSAIFPSSSSSVEFSRRCGSYAAVLVPLDLPSEVLCLPANLFRRSKMDLVVPPVFAAIVVALSAVVVRTMGLWEAEEAH
ncbi:unnamed protein product [Arabidopsis lyrata]|uniref:Uncharacterized protein n=1 Tax=Arabidopsis lyrata subsp. lyrata TaxID=81972 RepID=D7LJU6_ARALL|nr:uncharacterized protein LOC9317580 [Arabidopsis lyrata subsp. lyrata]EFH55940.1 hypothetical protein ARALYDRAFT_902896 [Arabidopsis lyrata subsp. lyrata]CAH8265055.1 unnamed protein product [Arabidopsis lyrata]|eukprot:XP_002879681.1 uncharacterized protein LOC9317580 [Arabidopsis lyrata subsp. lyrata]